MTSLEFSRWFKSGQKKSASYRVLSGSVKDGKYETTVKIIAEGGESLTVALSSRELNEFVSCVLSWIRTWPPPGKE